MSASDTDAPARSAPSASSEEDRALVTRALGGDQRAYSRLVEKYEGALKRHIGRLVGGAMRHGRGVEDLVQEAFAKAFKSLASYSPDYAFSTWLYRIATNHSIDYLRRRKLRTTSIDQPVQTKDGELKMELPDQTYRPDRHIEEDQQRVLIEEAIAELPEKYHRVIVMRHQQDMSYDEIAAALDLPLGTVKAHIFRARARLYQHLKGRRHDL